VRIEREQTMNRLRAIEREGLKTNIPAFDPGDTVRVMVRVREGDKERLQAFEGVCIGRRGAGINATFTVRKISAGVGVERIFPLHAPSIAELEREIAFWRAGGGVVAGVDEAGRGPLAGPVVAAAVVFPPHCKFIRGLRDSKLLPPAKRSRLALVVRARALAIGVGAASVREID